MTKCRDCGTSIEDGLLWCEDCLTGRVGTPKLWGDAPIQTLMDLITTRVRMIVFFQETINEKDDPCKECRRVSYQERKNLTRELLEEKLHRARRLRDIKKEK